MKQLLLIDRYAKRLFFLIGIFCASVSCGNDDDTSVSDTTNLPPVMNGQISVSFGIDGVTLEWDAATDPENDQLDYIIRYQSRELGSTDDYSGGYASVTDVTTHTRVVESNKAYKVTIEAQDIADNISEIPLVVEFDYSNTGPTEVTEISISKDGFSATFSWEPSTDPDNDAIEYRVEWYEFNDAFTDNPILRDTFVTTNTSLTISNLEESIKYWVNIIAVEQTPFELESDSERTYFAILPPGDTYVGDIVARDQGDIDIFMGHTYTTIDGSISVYAPGEGYGFLDRISNFLAFSGIQTITGNLTFNKGNNDYRHSFIDFDGFQDLVMVGNLFLISDTGFDNVVVNQYPKKDISAFSNLVSVGSLTLTDNIQGLTGDFSALTTVQENIVINDNGYFQWESIPPYEFGFPALQTIGGNFSAGANYHIIEMNHLEDIETIGGNFTIHHLSGIEDLSGLTSIGGNFRINGLFNVSTQNIYPNLSEIGGDFTVNDADASGTFSMDNLESIGGSFIYDNSNYNQVSVLSLSFPNLTSLNGGVHIEGSLFENLNFLNDISTITDLTLIDNDNLNELPNIMSLGSLYIENNNALTSIDLSNLSFTNSSNFEVTIKGNDNVSSIEFGNSTSNNTPIAVKISDHNELTSIVGLNGFTQFTSLEISNNPLLIDIMAFQNLSTIENCLQIYNNDDLTNLDFLSNLNTINCGEVCLEIFNNGSTTPTNNLVIKGNFNLGDYCGLTDLFNNNGLCLEEYSILENGYNPSHLDIINGNCSN